eukprot:3298043-Rhodomonas_salina.3
MRIRVGAGTRDLGSGRSAPSERATSPTRPVDRKQPHISTILDRLVDGIRPHNTAHRPPDTRASPARYARIARQTRAMRGGSGRSTGKVMKSLCRMRS